MVENTIKNEKLNNISSFYFSDGGFFEGYRKIEIITLEDKIVYSYKLKKIKRTLEIKKELWFNFIGNIMELGIKSWKKDYNNPNIEDGEQWEIKINYNNGNELNITGCNAYPKKWKIFKTIINDFIGGLEMGTGKVYVVYNEWIQDPETGKMPYKIGITKNPIKKRFYGLGLKMPGEFVCDFAYEFDQSYEKVEKTLHNMLNQLNVNGEWFNVNEEALEGIKNICEMAGGKLITELVENEIERETGEIKNPDFQILIDRWNEFSKVKAIGKSKKKRFIPISEISNSVYYVFRLRNTKEISIELGCWTKKYPNFDSLLNSYNGIKINGQLFNFPELSKREKDLGYKGKIRTIIPIKEIDIAINTMNALINETKENVIKNCNG